MFKVFAELIIPNLTVRPSIDEVQSCLNKIVQIIVSIAKNISQWNLNFETVGKLFDRATKKCLFYFQKKEKRERIPNENELESLQIPTENPYVRFRVNEINETNPLTNNFYKHISENKDIIKLISQLATCINTTRKVSIVFYVSINLVSLSRM